LLHTEGRLSVFPSSQARPAAQQMATKSSLWRFSRENPDLTAAVNEVGEGLPVVFLHGLVGLNEHWEGVVDRVSTKMRCILFELPLLQLRGDECSIQAVALLTARFLKEVIRQPAVLVGNSFGGHVGLRIALEQPSLCKALVLTGSSGLIEKTMFKEFT